MTNYWKGFLPTGAFIVAPVFAIDYEHSVVLDSAEILGQQQGNDFSQVESAVHNDGRFNRFFATLHGQAERVTGNDWMLERLHEARAIQVLREIKDTDAYKKGFDAALEAPLTLTRNTLNDPVATLESIPEGLSNFMQDVGAAVGGIGKGEDTDDNAMVKDLIGFTTVKRRLAADLAVDVYSSNQLLQKEMDDVAWSMFAGGAVIDVALSAAPLVASLAVEISDSANTGDVNWKVPPATLQQGMARAAKQAGLNDRELEALVFHKTCNLNHISSIVTNMTSLGAVDGVNDFYWKVGRLSAEHDCRVYRKSAELIYLYHVNKSPVKRIQMKGQAILLTDANNTQIAVVVADYLTYQPGSQPVFNIARYASNIWLSGGLSVAAQQVLSANNKLVEQSVGKHYKAPLDIVDVLLPERDQHADESAEGVNRTHEVVGDVTEGVGDVVGGVLGTLTSPLTGSSQSGDAEQNGQ